MAETMMTVHRGFLLTLDPLHVGSGGYRLGRVDLPIIREPGTNLPKIPGTSLSGAARAYAAMLKDGSPNGKIKCAGQREHCGDCDVCLTFGFSKSARWKEKAYSGMANIFDARLVLFPVASMAGPVWVTTRSALAQAGFEGMPEKEPEGAWITREWPAGHLNLGWLLIPVRKVAPPQLPKGLKAGEWDAIEDRIVITGEDLFSQVVNSNLEIRTSVSIDPDTGAAQEHALFTYEAIPRATWLHLEMVVHQYREFTGKKWKTPAEVVWGGLEMAETLGLGGMGTRGFGRVRVLRGAGGGA
jgi:CRISPR-associated protein Cmr4